MRVLHPPFDCEGSPLPLPLPLPLSQHLPQHLHLPPAMPVLQLKVQQLVRPREGQKGLEWTQVPQWQLQW